MDTPRSTISTALLIGSDLEPGTKAHEPILNPRTGALILDVAEASHAQIDRAVSAARMAWKLAPAIGGGNTVVSKPSEQTR
jgi:acyl-CoA reductase-like NAD-dependent aldehyde dehydrogenase